MVHSLPAWLMLQLMRPTTTRAPFFLRCSHAAMLPWLLLSVSCPLSQPACWNQHAPRSPAATYLAISASVWPPLSNSSPPFVAVRKLKSHPSSSQQPYPVLPYIGNHTTHTKSTASKNLTNDIPAGDSPRWIHGPLLVSTGPFNFLASSPLSHIPCPLYANANAAA